MSRVHIEKISENENAFRGGFDGNLLEPIVPGKPIRIEGEALDPAIRENGGKRMFTSSMVKLVIGNGGKGRCLRVMTENSMYEVTFL